MLLNHSDLTLSNVTKGYTDLKMFKRYKKQLSCT